MNRWDEIMGAALDVAVSLGVPEERRPQVAEDLITLVSHMLSGLGSVVSTAGEHDMGAARIGDDDFQQAYTRYVVGEDMQRAADTVRSESLEADLSRWDKFPGAGWAPRCVECGMRRAHKLDCATGR